jgi:nucleoside-diphosphate-sugar epimerase
MMRGLIGYTGFVGSNIYSQTRFEKKYNSKNIDKINGENFDMLVCAGVTALKWWANQNPEEDMRNIAGLMKNLKNVSAEIFVLISTVDVYAKPYGVDEDTKIITGELNAYGKNRRILEEFVQFKYNKHHIVRLPGLFGNGLKKNIIYDFCNNNEIEKIHSEAVYQFYGLDKIWKDIKNAIDTGIPIINFATEPIKVREIAKYAFGKKFTNEPYPDPPKYNMKTKYAKQYNSKEPYIAWKNDILKDILEFVRRKV